VWGALGSEEPFSYLEFHLDNIAYNTDTADPAAAEESPHRRRPEHAVPI
jgi:hypothetical protein